MPAGFQPKQSILDGCTLQVKENGTEALFRKLDRVLPPTKKKTITSKNISNMKTIDFIKSNPYRVMGLASNQQNSTMASNLTRLKAFASIGKHTSFLMDMNSVLNDEPERSAAAIQKAMAALNSTKGKLGNGLFWFMNMNDTDARILADLARDGNLAAARKAWAMEIPGVSAMQNQVVCYLLMGPEFYVHALRFANVLYLIRGDELVTTICNGLMTATADELMAMFMEIIVSFTDGDWQRWDVAVSQLNNSKTELMWAEAKASHYIKKLENALNAAKATTIHCSRDYHDAATMLMSVSGPLLASLRQLRENSPMLLSRQETITDNVCDEIIDKFISYCNSSFWFAEETEEVIRPFLFCHQNAESARIKKRCENNMNIILGREEDAPFFPNGKPDNLSAQDREKANEGIRSIVSSLNNLPGVIASLNRLPGVIGSLNKLPSVIGSLKGNKSAVPKTRRARSASSESIKP